MTTYTNSSSVPLSLAVFLATDNYDHDDTPNVISATALIKPVRQLILAGRVPEDMSQIQVDEMMPSRMGSAIHDAIERSWKTNHQEAMRLLGYPKKIIDRVVINPDPDSLPDGAIPIYLEQRMHRDVLGYTISGKFDFIGDGRLEDFKTTSAYSWIYHTNDDKYILQGSIYRWLNPKKITKDEMAIQFIFTDWSKAKAQSDPKYPPRRSMERVFPLMPLQATESFIRQKLELIEKFQHSPEAEIPECTDEDLWRSAPVFKYYKNPAKMSRSTKNFETKPEAYIRLAEDGNVGVVVEKPGEVTACKYCSAFPVCTQKDRLIVAGDLVL